MNSKQSPNLCTRLFQTGALCSGHFVYGVCDGLTAPTLILLQNSVSSDQMWLVLLASGLGMIAGGFIAGFLIDFIKMYQVDHATELTAPNQSFCGKLKNFLISYSALQFILCILLCISLNLQPVATNIWVLSIIRFFFGCACGGITNQDNVCIDIIWRDRIFVPMNVMQMFLGFGILFSPLLVYIIILVVPENDLLVLRISFGIISIITFFTGIYFLVIPKMIYTPTGGEDDKVLSRVDLKRRIKYSNIFWIFNGAMFLFLAGVLEFGVGDLVTYYLVTSGKATMATGDLVVVLHSAAYFFSRFLGILYGLVFPKRPHYLAFIHVIFEVICCILISVSFSLPPLQIIAFVAVGLGTGAIFPLATVVGRVIFSFEQTGFAGSMITFANAGCYIGPSIMQFFLTRAGTGVYPVFLLVISLVMLVVYVFVIYLGRCMSRRMLRKERMSVEMSDYDKEKEERIVDEMRESFLAKPVNSTGIVFKSSDGVYESSSAESY